MRGRGALTLALLLTAACGAPGEEEQAAAPADSGSVATARAAADDLGRDLMGLLLSTLEAEGPAAALAVCADSAQVRTARHAREGRSVRRIGTRLRNPANAPDSLEASLLATLAGAHARDGLPTELVRVRTDAAGGRELVYLRPIVLMPPCTACHGAVDDLAPGIADSLASRYPTDQATGYRAGDLRGAIVVRQPLD